MSLSTILTQRGPEILDLIRNEEFLDFITAPFISTMGLSAFALLTGGPLILGLWAYTEDFRAPAIVLALFSGVIITAAPGPAALIGAGIVMIALAIAFYAVYK